MKILTSTFFSVALISFISFNKQHSSTDDHTITANHIAAEELTKHQWTIAEYVENTDGTDRNTTLMLMPCEKDNILKFNPDNSYQLFESASKCNTGDPDIKGNGTWQYIEADNIINDRFSGGREVEKKILELNEGLLKIRFEQESKKIVTITYLSELGKKDETKKDQFVDNSDPISTITQMIREDLLKENKYTVVGLKSFKNGTAPSNPGSAKRIVVYPLTDMRNGDDDADVDATNNMLYDLGQKAMVDYVITGSLISAKSKKGNDGKAGAEISYTISILNIKKKKEADHESFEYPEVKKEKKGLGGLGNVIDKASKLAPGVFVLGSLAGSKSAALAGWYAMSYGSSATTVYNSGNSIFSSNVNEGARKDNFESSLSILQAIETTQKDLEKFIKKGID